MYVSKLIASEYLTDAIKQLDAFTSSEECKEVVKIDSVIDGEDPDFLYYRFTVIYWNGIEDTNEVYQIKKSLKQAAYDYTRHEDQKSLGRALGLRLALKCHGLMVLEIDNCITNLYKNINCTTYPELFGF